MVTNNETKIFHFEKVIDGSSEVFIFLFIILFKWVCNMKKIWFLILIIPNKIFHLEKVVSKVDFFERHFFGKIDFQKGRERI